MGLIDTVCFDCGCMASQAVRMFPGACAPRENLRAGERAGQMCLCRRCFVDGSSIPEAGTDKTPPCGERAGHKCPCRLCFVDGSCTPEAPTSTASPYPSLLSASAGAVEKK